MQFVLRIAPCLLLAILLLASPCYGYSYDQIVVMVRNFSYALPSDVIMYGSYDVPHLVTEVHKDSEKLKLSHGLESIPQTLDQLRRCQSTIELSESHIIRTVSVPLKKANQTFEVYQIVDSKTQQIRLSESEHPESTYLLVDEDSQEYAEMSPSQFEEHCHPYGNWQLRVRRPSSFPSPQNGRRLLLSVGGVQEQHGDDRG
ncbi:unnamed protein product [Sphagnum tenellum]